MTTPIRLACLEDGKQIGQLIYDTVHSINRQDYTQEQVNTWVPDPIIYSQYEESYAYVAELKGKILGFANLTSVGYLHRFYVHKDFQGQQIGSQLLKALESKAKELKLKEIITEASLTAYPFFLAKEYLVREKQTIILRGMAFINYKMYKKI
jgi:putative acetyltransferase